MNDGKLSVYHDKDGLKVDKRNAYNGWINANWKQCVNHTSK